MGGTFTRSAGHKLQISETNLKVGGDVINGYMRRLSSIKVQGHVFSSSCIASSVVETYHRSSSTTTCLALITNRAEWRSSLPCIALSDSPSFRVPNGRGDGQASLRYLPATRPSLDYHFSWLVQSGVTWGSPPLIPRSIGTSRKGTLDFAKPGLLRCAQRTAPRASINDFEEISLDLSSRHSRHRVWPRARDLRAPPQ